MQMSASSVKSQPVNRFPWGNPDGAPATDHAVARRQPDDRGCRDRSGVESRSSHHQLFPSSSIAPLTNDGQISAHSVKSPSREVEKGKEKLENKEEEDDDVKGMWNLRPRKGPLTGAAKKNNVVFTSPEVRGGNKDTQRTRQKVLSGESPVVGSGRNRRQEKMRLWIALSKEEIEEDIFIMTGNRPARKPKKRAKNVQKQLDNAFPGLWLMGVTADCYRVNDAPAKR